MNQARARRLKEAVVSPVLARPGGGTRELVVDGRAIALTNPDRVLYPGTGFTKADLAAYYLGVADAILPHLGDRPLTVGRFPGGVDGRGFAQTEVPGRPDWIPTMELALMKGPKKRFTLVRERAALVWLAQMGTIEIHAFPGLPHDLERTKAVLFDLDPKGDAGVLEVAAIALVLRDHLATRGLDARVKTSGSRGMHVTADVAESIAVREARAIAADAATALERELRAARVLLDARQNSPRLTTVVPYSLRSTSRPLVSTPVGWDEVEAAVRARDASRLVFGAADVVRRVAGAATLADR